MAAYPFPIPNLLKRSTSDNVGNSNTASLSRQISFSKDEIEQSEMAKINNLLSTFSFNIACADSSSGWIPVTPSLFVDSAVPETTPSASKNSTPHKNISRSNSVVISGSYANRINFSRSIIATDISHNAPTQPYPIANIPLIATAADTPAPPPTLSKIDSPPPSPKKFVRGGTLEPERGKLKTLEKGKIKAVPPSAPRLTSMPSPIENLYRKYNQTFTITRAGTISPALLPETNVTPVDVSTPLPPTISPIQRFQLDSPIYSNVDCNSNSSSNSNTVVLVNKGNHANLSSRPTEKTAQSMQKAIPTHTASSVSTSRSLFFSNAMEVANTPKAQENNFSNKSNSGTLDIFSFLTNPIFRSNTLFHWTRQDTSSNDYQSKYQSKDIKERMDVQKLPTIYKPGDVKNTIFYRLVKEGLVKVEYPNEHGLNVPSIDPSKFKRRGLKYWIYNADIQAVGTENLRDTATVKNKYSRKNAIKNAKKDNDEKKNLKEVNLIRDPILRNQTARKYKIEKKRLK